ncbi:MAG: hypothetical protein H0W96_06570 [Solirubrobacterales bacterium]|nr:hypothetical protein [Solirubrobacterales bacterium]
MGLKDRIADGASKVGDGAKGLASSAAAKAKETVVGSEAGARLLAIVQIDDDRPLTPERLLVMLVDAVNGDEQMRELSHRDVVKAAKKRQRLAGTAGALGGPIGLQLASLYCEAELLCDVAERHRLELTDEELAAHLLVLWNAMPDLATARAAIDGSGLSVAARVAIDAHAKVVTKPREEMTKRDVVKMIWRLRNVAGDVDLPGSNNPLNVLLPGKRVKAFTAAAEQQLGVEAEEKRGRFGGRR